MKTIFITSEWVEISYKPLATAKWFINLAPLGNQFCLLKSSIYSLCIKKKHILKYLQVKEEEATFWCKMDSSDYGENKTRHQKRKWQEKPLAHSSPQDSVQDS